MNIFCYFTISHVASVRVIRRNYAHGERNKIRVKKKFELNGIQVMQRDYVELIRQTLLGIEKSLSKDYFALSRIRVKRWQLYLKMQKIHHKNLKVIYQSDVTYDDLLQLSNSVSLH